MERGWHEGSRMPGEGGGLLGWGLGGLSCLRAVQWAACGSREALGGSRTLGVVVRPLREGFSSITGLAAAVCCEAGVRAGGKPE